jgi:hypothetical protein
MHNISKLYTQQVPNLHGLQFCVVDASPLSEQLQHF